jgi:hypothetical protein
LAAAAALGLAVTTTPAPAFSRDREFGLLVRHIESYYHARRAHRLLLGFALGPANFVMRIWRPCGVKNVKLALFENPDFSDSRYDLDFPAVVRAGLREGWQPMVQVYSRRTGERTYVFARDAGKYVKLLVATLEPDEAVVVQVNLNPDKLSRAIERWTDKPESTSASARQEPYAAQGK